MNDGTLLPAAEALRQRGWRVFPVNGKTPATLHGLKDASDRAEDVERWWTRWPTHGIGVATGRASGFWVLDLDGPPGKNALLELQKEHGDLPHTVAARTGKGWHVYWRMPEHGDVRNSAGKVAEGVDVRGTGGYVVVPPSPHPSGGTYAWVEGRAPGEAEIAEAPSWLMGLVTARSKKTADVADPVPENIPAGGRNQALASLAGTMRRRGMAKETILAALQEENRLKCEPPLEDEEVEKIAHSVSRYEPTAPPRVPADPPSANGDHPTPARLATVTWEAMERMGLEKTKPIDAIPTPWPTWNRVSRGAGGGQGLARGWHVVVGASSGAGKSLVAANLAAKAIQAGVDTCLFSLEMSQLENVTRMLAILTGEEIRALEHGKDFNLERWNAAAERLLEQPGTLRTNDRPIHHLHEITTAMRHHAEEGCRLMIVDYLQLAWVGTADTMYQQITEVSHAIQGAAKDLKVTTVGLSQVNRRTSSGADRLQKEGLMGGSSLENDAEQVVLLGKPERQYDGLLSDVRLDKNRHGPAVEWKIRTNPRTLQMHEVEA